METTFSTDEELGTSHISPFFRPEQLKELMDGLERLDRESISENLSLSERIREELAIGNSPQASILGCYEKAFSTIADANITTLLAAMVLFSFGTGPVKGFAVTLALGIVTSMFTAILGTRALINLIYGYRQVPVLAIGRQH